MLNLDTIQDDARDVVERVGVDTLEPLRGARLLVTGGCGFLLSNVLDAVAALNATPGEPCDVVVVDNLVSGFPDRVAHLQDDARFRFVHHDIVKPLSLDGTVDYLIHGASIASPVLYRQKPLETIDVNVTGTRHLLDFALHRGARGVLFMSTSEIYGDPTPDAIPTAEGYRGLVSCTGPRACYDEGKRLGETLCSVYHRTHGLPVRMIRPFNVYGPGQRLDDGRILPDLLRAGLAGEPIVLHSDGRATRSFCYAADFITGLMHVLVGGVDGEPYNIGNDEEVSIRDLAGMMGGLAGVPIESAVSDDPDYLTDNPQRRCPDLGKIKALCGYAVRYPVRDGLARTFASYGGGGA